MPTDTAATCPCSGFPAIRPQPSAWRAWRRVKLTRRSSSTSRPEGRPMGGFLIPEPAERRRGGVVAGGAATLHGARAELEQLPAQLPGAAELGGDLGVGERAPQSVGASHDDVVRLERTAPGERHVGQDRVAAEAGLA